MINKFPVCLGFILLNLLFLLGCQEEHSTLPLTNIISDSSSTIIVIDDSSNTIDINKTVLKKSNKTIVAPTINKNKKEIYIPKPKTSWHWQLSGKINTNYDVELYDIDLYTPQTTIDLLHKKGIKVICYFSAGSVDKQRKDAGEFPKEVIGNTLKGWPDEKWLDISNYKKFSKIIEKRLDLAVSKKCDGVEPDNVDAYQNKNGFSLTYTDQLNYNKWLAKQAHERGLSIALKNDLEQVKDLVDYFDFAVNEQCFEYDECELLTQFIKQKKAVFGVEYESDLNDFCEKANKMNFSWLKLSYNLAGERTACS